MATGRLDAERGQADKPDGNGIQIVAVDLDHFQVHHVTRHGMRDENHHVVDPGDSFPFGSDVGHFDVLDNGIVFYAESGHGGRDCTGFRVKKRLHP